MLSHVCLFCDPRNCSPPGSSVHGIFQARILEWVAISFSKGSSFFQRIWFRDPTQVSCIAGRFFTVWDTSEGKLKTTITASTDSIQFKCIYKFEFLILLNNVRERESLQPAQLLDYIKPWYNRWSSRHPEIISDYFKFTYMLNNIMSRALY